MGDRYSNRLFSALFEIGCFRHKFAPHMVRNAQ